jgi:hypothetical protein
VSRRLAQLEARLEAAEQEWAANPAKYRLELFLEEKNSKEDDPDLRVAIINYARRHPQEKQKEIARIFGVSLSRVSSMCLEAGLRRYRGPGSVGPRKPRKIPPPPGNISAYGVTFEIKDDGLDDWRRRFLGSPNDIELQARYFSMYPR